MSSVWHARDISASVCRPNALAAFDLLILEAAAWSGLRFSVPPQGRNLHPWPAAAAAELHNVDPRGLVPFRRTNGGQWKLSGSLPASIRGVDKWAATIPVRVACRRSIGDHAPSEGSPRVRAPRCRSREVDARRAASRRGRSTCLTALSGGAPGDRADNEQSKRLANPPRAPDVTGFGCRPDPTGYAGPGDVEVSATSSRT